MSTQNPIAVKAAEKWFREFEPPDAPGKSTLIAIILSAIEEATGDAYGRGVTAGKLEALKYTPEERERYGKWVAGSRAATSGEQEDHPPYFPHRDMEPEGKRIGPSPYPPEPAATEREAERAADKVVQNFSAFMQWGKEHDYQRQQLKVEVLSALSQRPTAEQEWPEI